MATTLLEHGRPILEVFSSTVGGGREGDGLRLASTPVDDRLFVFALALRGVKLVDLAEARLSVIVKLVEHF